MLAVRKRYIVLLALNVIALTTFFVLQSSKAKDPFDTQYVIGLLEKEEKLLRSIRDFEAKLDSSGDMLSQAQVELEQTQMMITRSEEKYQNCESETISLLNLIECMPYIFGVSMREINIFQGTHSGIQINDIFKYLCSFYRLYRML